MAGSTCKTLVIYLLSSRAFQKLNVAPTSGLSSQCFQISQNMGKMKKRGSSARLTEFLGSSRSQNVASVNSTRPKPRLSTLPQTPSLSTSVNISASSSAAKHFSSITSSCGPVHPLGFYRYSYSTFCLTDTSYTAEPPFL